MVARLKIAILVGAALILAACQGQSDALDGNETAVGEAASALPLFGDGYPEPGDPCRRVGESQFTFDYLDDSADLVGCPDRPSALALGGTVLESLDGIILVSVPRVAASSAGSNDALVAGTHYNATADIECSGYRNHKAGRCPAGVKRNQEDGLTIVDIEWPAGDSRTLYFKDGNIVSANTNEADGTAGFDVTGDRNDDLTTVRIGPERYIIPDAFLMGG